MALLRRAPVRPARAGMRSAARATAHQGAGGWCGGVGGFKSRSSPCDFLSCGAFSAMPQMCAPDEVHLPEARQEAREKQARQLGEDGAEQGTAVHASFEALVFNKLPVCRVDDEDGPFVALGL